MRQCLIDLDEELRNATSEFINEQLGSDRAAILVSFRLDEIKNRLVRETFEEQLETSDWRHEPGSRPARVRPPVREGTQ